MPEIDGWDRGLAVGLSLFWPLLPHLSEDLHLISKSPATTNALCLYNWPHDKVQVPSSTDKY